MRSGVRSGVGSSRRNAVGIIVGSGEWHTPQRCQGCQHPHSTTCTFHCTLHSTFHCTLHCTFHCTLPQHLAQHVPLHTPLHVPLHVAHAPGMHGVHSLPRHVAVGGLPGLGGSRVPKCAAAEEGESSRCRSTASGTPGGEAGRHRKRCRNTAQSTLVERREPAIRSSLG